MKIPSSPSLQRGYFTAVLVLAAALVSCDGSQGPPGPPGPPTPPGLGPGDDLPGLIATITNVIGGSGAGGSVAAGDLIGIEFTVTDGNGTALTKDELDRGSAMVSGPTFNYQRVIASQSDVLDQMTEIGPGKFVYEFSVPVPATYLAPLNDSPNFTIGELTGQPLLDGTYTVGLELRKDYEIEGESYADAANTTADFLFGGAPQIAAREVVTDANCNACHGQLRLHGGNRTDVANCVLCHTAGAEDKNDPSVEGGTPDITIEFKVMVHKIHSGKGMPSVLGVTTSANGSRDYTATPKPYKIVGYRNSVHDYSKVGFPLWPSSAAPMPRDTGYSNLSSTEKSLEDQMRSAVVDCDKCHGDPDGPGPLPAPAQGNLIYSQPSRLACGSCHDDWVWDLPYTSNQQTMPSQTSDSACIICHKVSGHSLDVVDAHTHPLKNPALSNGTNFDLQGVAEAGINDSDGTIDPGEKVQLKFTIKDDSGADIDPSKLIRFEAAFTGPTWNPQMINFVSIPPAGIGNGPSYTINMPEKVFCEYLGDATANIGDTFATAKTPHWDVMGAETEVLVRTATGAASALAATVLPGQNFVDVNVGTGSSFVRDDFIVIEDGIGGQEEYLQIQWVDGDRLWFSSPATPSYPPGVTVMHGAGASVLVVTLTAKVRGSDYSLDANTGMITENTEFGAGNAVVCVYTSDFVMPAGYGATMNESPTLDESWGDWLGKTLVNGTYTAAIYASQSFAVDAFGEITNYTDAAPGATRDVLVGDATTITPDDGIASADACNKCHDDLAFHGSGRRGYQTCVLCHGLAGAEDRPRYVAANAPDNAVSIDFRTMLHKIHRGKELSHAASYTVVGFGTGYPNNFSLHGYDGVGFPYQPGGTAACERCHGPGNNAWQEPAPRDHPTEQGSPVRVWGTTCGACHDSNSNTAHIDVNTSSSGAESCATCHGLGKFAEVPLSHESR